MRLGVLVIGRLNTYSAPSVLYREDETDRTDAEVIQAILEGLEGSAKADSYQMGMPRYQDFLDDGFGIKVDISNAERLAVVQWTHECASYEREWTLAVDILIGELRYTGRIYGKMGVPE